MSKRCVLVVALCLGVTGCNGQQLTRFNAQHLLRQNLASGSMGGEITGEAKVEISWDDGNWGTGKAYEITKLSAQSLIDFYSHLVDAGVLRKTADTFMNCAPQPECKEHNKIINFDVVSSPDVTAVYPSDREMEFASIVLGRPSEFTVTGVSQQGNDADVEFTAAYKVSSLYARIYPLIKDDLSKCSNQELWLTPGAMMPNPPLYCRQNWPNVVSIVSKKITGRAHFTRYDDGWRIEGLVRWDK